MRKFISVRTEIFRLPHGVIFPGGRRHFFPAEGGEFSYLGKFPFVRRKMDRPSEGKRLPSEGRKNAVRTQRNFLPQEKKFPCGRKYFFLRKEILRLAHSGHSLGARRKKNEPSEAGRLAQRRRKRRGWLRSCEASPSSFEAGEGEGDCPLKREGVATAP